MDDRVDQSQAALNIKVTKSQEDKWELLVDTALTQDYESEGTVIDAEHFFSRYFGIYCRYTSTRSDKFFFDNLSVTGEIFTDDEIPEIDTITVFSDSSIQLQFNEKMNASSMSNLDNYIANNGIGNPAEVQETSDSSVIIYFPEKFNDAIENQLSIQGVRDLFGNAINNIVLEFTYFTPYIIGFGDVIITEIMADPTPGVDLPEYEYLEIHNPHPEIFNLDNVSLIVGQDTTYVPDLVIEPHEYIILCQHAAVEHFEKMGRAIKVTNWPSLNNRGEQVILFNKNGEVVCSVNYNDNWYKSIERDDGGYSLEMVDTDFPCKGEENWMASTDPSGGTPGNENAAKDQLTNLSAPEIAQVIATTANSLNIKMNEKIGPQHLNVSDFQINPHLNINEFHLAKPDFSAFELSLDESIIPKTQYTLTIKNLEDCAGNIQKETSTSFVLPETADSLDLIINEILFNPIQGGVDFVEIYNRSEKYIDLSSVSLSNELFEPMTNEHFIIEPQTFISITEDPDVLGGNYPKLQLKNTLKSSHIPAYNNDAGDVRLVDNHGKTLDFFHYDESYHSPFLNDTEGVSLERISFEGASNDPGNWQSAASTVGYATPGEKNSQYLAMNGSNAEIVIDPQVFAPDNNGFHDFTIIKCRLSTAGNMANIQILDPAGRQIRTIISHQSIGAEADFKWEGLNDKGEEVSRGAYIVYVEIYNSAGERKQYRKKVVVGRQL